MISLIYPVKFTTVRSAAHFTGAKAPPVPLHYAGQVRALARERIPEVVELQLPGVGTRPRKNTQLLDQPEAVFLNLIDKGFAGIEHVGAEGFGLDTVVNLCSQTHEN